MAGSSSEQSSTKSPSSQYSTSLSASNPELQTQDDEIPSQKPEGKIIENKQENPKKRLSELLNEDAEDRSTSTKRSRKEGLKSSPNQSPIPFKRIWSDHDQHALMLGYLSFVEKWNPEKIDSKKFHKHVKGKLELSGATPVQVREKVRAMKLRYAAILKSMREGNIKESLYRFKTPFERDVLFKTWRDAWGKEFEGIGDDGDGDAETVDGNLEEENRDAEAANGNLEEENGDAEAANGNIEEENVSGHVLAVSNKTPCHETVYGKSSSNVSSHVLAASNKMPCHENVSARNPSKGNGGSRNTSKGKNGNKKANECDKTPTLERNLHEGSVVEKTQHEGSEREGVRSGLEGNVNVNDAEHVLEKTLTVENVSGSDEVEKARTEENGGILVASEEIVIEENGNGSEDMEIDKGNVMENNVGNDMQECLSRKHAAELSSLEAEGSRKYAAELSGLGVEGSRLPSENDLRADRSSPRHDGGRVLNDSSEPVLQNGKVDRTAPQRNGFILFNENSEPVLYHEDAITTPQTGLSKENSEQHFKHREFNCTPPGHDGVDSFNQNSETVSHLEEPNRPPRQTGLFREISEQFFERREANRGSPQCNGVRQHTENSDPVLHQKECIRPAHEKLHRGANWSPLGHGARRTQPQNFEGKFYQAEVNQSRLRSYGLFSEDSMPFGDSFSVPRRLPILSKENEETLEREWRQQQKIELEAYKKRFSLLARECDMYIQALDAKESPRT